MAEYVLFVTRNDIVRFTAMNGNVDVDRYLQFCKIGQDRMIQPLLGTKLFEKIQDDIQNNVLVNPYKALLEDRIKQVILFYTMVEYLPWGNVQVSNKGIFKFTQENGQIVDKSEVDDLVENARSTGEFYAQRLIDHLCQNSNLYPEYNQNTNDDISPTTQNYWGGWVL
tara:strand:+ start:78 stop:581 length:504 start_codon:yes stop_codon:yes gene_type:complete